MDHYRVSSSTKLVQVVLSDVKKPSSGWGQFFSFLWVIGALLVVIVYLIIPIFVALYSVPNILLKFLFAACILLSVELLVSVILWKTSPTRTPTVAPRPGEYDERSTKS